MRGSFEVHLTPARGPIVNHRRIDAPQSKLLIQNGLTSSGNHEDVEHVEEHPALVPSANSTNSPAVDVVAEFSGFVEQEELGLDMHGTEDRSHPSLRPEAKSTLCGRLRILRIDSSRTSPIDGSSGGPGRVPEQGEEEDDFYPAALARRHLVVGGGRPRRLTGPARRLLQRQERGPQRQALVGSRFASGPTPLERTL